MPKIPLINSQRSLPSNAGNAYIQDNSGQIVGNAIQNLGETLRVVEEKSAEKKAKLDIREARRGLSEMSRVEFGEAASNRLGENALPSKEKNYPGVYEDYRKKADEYISKALGKVDPRFKGQGDEILGGVKERYMEKFLGHQLTQQSVHKKKVLHGDIAELQEELRLSMASGGSIEDIEFVNKEIETMTQEWAKGADTTEFLKEKKAALYESAIVAASGFNPEQAEEMLKDKKVIKALDPKMIDSLEKKIESDWIDQTTKKEVNRITSAGISYESQIKAQEAMPTSTPREREAANRVHSELTTIETHRKSAETRQRFGIREQIWKDVIDKKNESGLTYDTIINDPKNVVLDHTDKAWVTSLFAGKGSGEFPVDKRMQAWYEATKKIIMGPGVKDGWDEEDIMNNAGTAFDFRDAKALVGFARGEAINPRMYDVADVQFRQNYLTQYKNESRKASVLYGVMERQRQYKEDNGRYPNEKEVLDMLHIEAAGFEKTSWYGSSETVKGDRLKKTYGTIGEPQYQYIGDDEKRLDHREIEEIKYREEGFPQAQYLSAHNMYLLGKTKGAGDAIFFVTSGGDKQQAMPGTAAHKTLQSLLDASPFKGSTVE